MAGWERTSAPPPSSRVAIPPPSVSAPSPPPASPITSATTSSSTSVAPTTSPIPAPAVAPPTAVVPPPPDSSSVAAVCEHGAHYALQTHLIPASTCGQVKCARNSTNSKAEERGLHLISAWRCHRRSPRVPRVPPRPARPPVARGGESLALDCSAARWAAQGPPRGAHPCPGSTRPAPKAGTVPHPNTEGSCGGGRGGRK